MDEARRLAPAEEGKKLRHCGVDARRHCEARQDDERKQHEHHREIGELLEHIVALRGFPAREAKAQMIEDVGADMAKLREARQKVAPEMAARQAEDQIGKAVCYEEPGEEEMPPPAS